MKKNSEIQDAKPEVKFPVGEELMQWAEKYWHIDEIIKSNNDGNAEILNYNSFRNAVVIKVNEILEERLNPVK